MIILLFKNFEKYLIVLTCTLSITHILTGQPTNNQFRGVVGRSSFVFKGTVLYPDSSNVDIPINAPKAVVRIDTVVDAPKGYSSFNGRNITVIFAPNASHPQGVQQVFYTVGWYFGKTLGLREIKNNFTNTFQPNLAAKIRLARDQILDDSLVAELHRAPLVIYGVVRVIDTVSITAVLGGSEHNPKLRRAKLKITEILKGTVNSGDSLFGFFASSYDLLWLNSPKLSTGQSAIFLLHNHQAPILLNLGLQYTLLDQRDVQKEAELARIKDLLKK